VIRHFFTAQFLRFLAVGGISALVNWLTRILLGQWLSFSWSVVLAYGAGMTMAFVLNRILVFPLSTKPAHRQLRDFVLVNLGSFPVVWAASVAIEAGLRLAGMTRHTEALAHGVAIAIPMFATFLIYKFLAFRDVDHGRL
jgi:putative flippase GtrA